MAESKKKRRARGEGNIRQRKDGTWEARFVIGIDPGTGKEIRKSVYAKTQKEVRQKMTAAIAALDSDDYKEPCKMTLTQWLDIWATEYLGGLKPRTVVDYTDSIKNHIKPALGAIKLDALTAHTIQKFYNALAKPSSAGGKGLSPKTVRCVHGVLHKALQQAIMIGYIRANPTDACILPHLVKPEIKPLDDQDTARFLEAIKGNPYETIFLVTIFTGMRKGEVMGLTWDCIDFGAGTITINKQLQADTADGRKYNLVPTKNGKGRVVAPAPYVMQLLRAHQRQQLEMRLKAGPAWVDTGLVFTDGVGNHISPHTVYNHYKRIVKSIGIPNARFHDLRHSYAVAAIQSGDDIKTVQGNLGHATASFTLDVYGHVTEKMKRESAERMQAYIDSIKKSG
ncbi:MAG: site-specific integrase [Oscillospiraceae bacterium]|nr:site-specific integrase [Oscillospiraceae bacterium]